MRALAEIPTMMLVAWVWGIATFLWLLLDKLDRLPPRETRESAVKFIVKLLGFATLGCLGLLLAIPCWHLPQQPWDSETVAAIIRITGGNFRLLNRLLTQMERILEINALRQVN